MALFEVWGREEDFFFLCLNFTKPRHWDLCLTMSANTKPSLKGASYNSVLLKVQSDSKCRCGRAAALKCLGISRECGSNREKNEIVVVRFEWQKFK